MLARLNWRGVVASFFATAALAALIIPAGAQTPSGEPIKIGFGMALTGPLAPNGKQALLGMKIWEEETNAKGGLLGRPVKLVYYDDQSNPATVPGIYTKLLDVDKVDLVLGGYATNMNAPAMPVVMQKGKTFISLFGARRQLRVQIPEVLLGDSDRPDPEGVLYRGLLPGRRGAESQADDRCACGRGRGIFPQCLRRRAGKFQEVRVQDRLRQVLSAEYDGLHADRPRDPGRQCRPRSIICSYPLSSVGIVHGGRTRPA